MQSDDEQSESSGKYVAPRPDAWEKWGPKIRSAGVIPRHCINAGYIYNTIIYIIYIYIYTHIDNIFIYIYMNMHVCIYIYI